MLAARNNAVSRLFGDEISSAPQQAFCVDTLALISAFTRIVPHPHARRLQPKIPTLANL